MKTIQTVILGVLVLVAAEAQAQFSVLTNADHTLTITGYSGPPWDVTIPSSISGAPVSSIGNRAFLGAPLTSVVISPGIGSIGDFAFGNTSVANITMPGSITNIGSAAFFGCTNLASLVIPDSVTIIGDEAFGNTSLTAFTIPDGVARIEDFLFYQCTNLSSVTIGSGVVLIESSAFVGCTSLTSITIPNSVTNIGDSAFYGCTSLTNITIPISVASINSYAFANTGLGKVYFPGNAPVADSTVFFGDNSAIAYYNPGTSGWGSHFGGAPAIMLNPPVSAGSLQVSILPAGAAVAGAQWQVDGGVPQPGGASVVGLTLGSHALSFSTVAGWTAPANLTVTIASGKIARATGLYQKGNPVSTITSPKSGQSVSNALLLISGTVKDNVPASGVYYQLNGGDWVPATSSNSWRVWTGGVTLSPGPNTLSAYAIDTSGSISTTNSVTFKYIVSATLTLVANGAGSITPNLNGKLLAIGSRYTLKATPSSINLFSNWVGGATMPYAVLSRSNSCTFTMQSNLVIQANFVPNPFIAQKGTFTGLFLNTNGATEANSGFLTLTLLPSGAFTGKILTSGRTYTIPTTAKFDISGQTQFTIPARPNSLAFNLQLDINNPANQQITGTVFDGTGTSELTANRAVFNALNRPLNYQGLFTLAVAASDDAAASPGGFGSATLSINSSGLISMKGNLADGAPMSQSVSISKDGQWPFYVAYAAPPAGNGGAVVGWINFSNLPASSLGGTLYWFRPAGKTPALYQSGFSNAVPVIGSAYNPSNKPALALSTGQVTLNDGNLSFSITNQINLALNNMITVPASASNTNKLMLTIGKTTGSISGSFANPTNPKQTIKINGVLLQNLTNAAGYFLGTNQSGAFLLETP